MKMKTNFKRFIMCILCCFLVLSFSSFSSAGEKSKSSILGFGPIAGDLVKPSSTVVYDGKLYVLDQTGINVFDIETQELTYKHIVNYQKNFLADFETMQNIYEYHYHFSYETLKLSSPIGKNFYHTMLIDQKYYVQPTMCLDSNHNLYVASQEGIYVISIDSMTSLKVLSYPSSLLEQKDDHDINIITMKMYQDKLFLLTTVYCWGQKSISMTQLDLDGAILNTVEFQFDEFARSKISEPDFIYIQDHELYGIIYTVEDYWDKAEDPYRYPILWFNSLGENVVVGNQNGLPDDCTGIDYCTENQKITLAGHDYGSKYGQNGQFVLSTLHLVSDENDSYSLVLDSTDQEEEFGCDCTDITLYNDAVMLITTGQFQESWNYRVYRLTENSIDQYGTTPNRLGQINESLSFCVDENATLYTHNNSQTFLNLFDTNGECKPSIDLNYDLISHRYSTARSTFLSDISIHDDKLVFVGLSPCSITEYSIQDKIWKLLYAGSGSFPRILSDVQYYDDQYYFMAAIYWTKNIPNLYTTSDEYSIKLIEGFQRAHEDYKNPSTFIGFNITNVHHEDTTYPEYQFLDYMNQTICVYNYEKKLKEIVQLPKDENSFYSSFDIYPDGSWIVTDFTQHRLLHIAKNGELIEIFGSKGQVEIGSTKEAYLEKPDQFYFPIRAKIANNNIYVSDFGNCRYHVIPIENDKSG